MALLVVALGELYHFSWHEETTTSAVQTAIPLGPNHHTIATAEGVEKYGSLSRTPLFSESRDTAAAAAADALPNSIGRVAMQTVESSSSSAALEFRLVGTSVNQISKRGLVGDASSGSIARLSPGERLGEFEVLDITTRELKLRRGSEVTTLSMPAKSSPGENGDSQLRAQREATGGAEFGANPLQGNLPAPP